MDGNQSCSIWRMASTLLPRTSSRVPVLTPMDSVFIMGMAKVVDRLTIMSDPGKVLTAEEQAQVQPLRGDRFVAVRPISRPIDRLDGNCRGLRFGRLIRRSSFMLSHTPVCHRWENLPGFMQQCPTMLDVCFNDFMGLLYACQPSA